MTDPVKLVADPLTTAKLESVVAQVMQSSDFLSLDYLKNRAWAAVPVESALHFDESDAERIALAARNVGYQECNAAAAEKLADPKCFRVELSDKGLYAFSKKVSHLKYLLFPDDVSFLIFCSTEDHYVVAGERQFVEAAIGCDAALGRERFVEYAGVETNTSVRNFLYRISGHYERASKIPT